MINEWKRYNNSVSPHSKLLLQVEFKTVQDYLRDLEIISRTLCLHDKSSVTYLAAAVSDFYIPDTEVVEHKI